jgi:predicted HicB family RNase H-like nuclease
MEESRKGPKRLTLDIPELLHAELKMRAAFRHMSLRSYVMNALGRHLATEHAFIDNKKRPE